MTVFHLNNMRRHMYRYILVFCTQNVYERLYILPVPVTLCFSLMIYFTSTSMLVCVLVYVFRI